MGLSIRSRLALGLAPALVALAVVGALAYGSLEVVEGEQRWVTHTVEVLQRLEQTATGLAEAESNARAYRLTSDGRFLAHYQTAATRLYQDITSLRYLTRDNPEQQARLAELDPLIGRRLHVLELLIDRRVRNDGPREEELLREESARYSERGRELLAAMRATERGLLDERRERALYTSRTTETLIVAVSGLTFIVALAGLVLTGRSILRPLQQLKFGAQRVGAGEYAHRVPVESDEFGQVAEVFNRMTEQVHERELKLSDEDWIKSRLVRFPAIYQAHRRIEPFCRAVLSELAACVDVPHAVLYRRVRREGIDNLERCATFAAEQAPQRLALGEGAAGQSALEGRVLRLCPLPSGHVHVSSALGASVPSELWALPAQFEGEVRMVLELAFLSAPDARAREFMDRLMGSMAVALAGIEARQELESALEQSRRLAIELKNNQDELSQSYEELEAQAEHLRQSERLLREQQDELRQANDEYEQVNAELRQASTTLEERSRELEAASAYKSEFLANMSHELRTPLNSLLILSQLLSENRERTLTDKQVQYARTIHDAGEDLLALISDILDLAKIESGTVEIELEAMPLAELLRSADSSFRAMAEAKGLGFELRRAPGMPDHLDTDARRLWQIVKNLLSNAFKFTERGRVVLSIDPSSGPGGGQPGGAWIAIAVADTGVGIAPEQQSRIFESFHQGDRGTARKFGGTGLGLAISQRLARLMGGVIEVDSTPGEGSRFALYLPLQPAQQVPHEAAAPAPAPAPAPVRPSAHTPAPQAAARSVMVAHRDGTVVHHITSTARPRGFDVVAVSELGKIVSSCQRLNPMLVVLEAAMEDEQGWVALGLLKQNPATRHVPVLLVCERGDRERAVRLGAASAMTPGELTRQAIEDVLGAHLERLARPFRRLLAVEDDEAQRAAILELIGDGDVQATGVGSGSAALEALGRTTYDCVVVDLGLPDMEGTELLRAMHERFGARCPPVVVYTARDLTRADEAGLKAISDAIIVKGASSPERLFSETALLLNRQQSRLPERKQRMIERGNEEDPVLGGRRVLVVDDDVRNIFAVTAALEAYGVTVLHADCGAAGLELAAQEPAPDAVLMDVMMPGMDGFEAMRRLRAMPGRERVPVIAITAKAMPGDRRRCLDAGASDYLTKPVDMDRLRAMLRVWLTTADAP